MVKKYKKKPVVIEAIQWDGSNVWDVLEFIGKHESIKDMSDGDIYEMITHEGLKIFTLEGTMKADAKDFIIKGVKGEFYPCKPDIFEKTYEKV